MPSRSTIALPLAGLVGLTLAGCSFSMRTNPERWTPDLPTACDATRIPPLVDLLVGGLLATASISAFSDASDNSSELGRALEMALGTVTAIPAFFYLGGSALGFYRAHTCRSAREQRRRWRQENPIDDRE